MSQFLGFIHHMMYGKIQRQEALTKELCKQAKEFGWTDSLVEQLDETCGIPKEGNLEEIIDLGNIHGWLQAQVNLVETRFAKAVCILTKENEDRLEKIKEMCRTVGKNTACEMPRDSSVKELFDSLGQFLLDGMPCDGGVDIHNAEEDEILWSVDGFVHVPYWEKEGMSSETFFNLRDAWLQGFFEDRDVDYERIGESTFRIKEK